MNESTTDERATGDDTPDRVPAPVRLRSAGFGVILGGLLLPVLAVPFEAPVATLVLALLAASLAIVGRKKGTWWMQLCLGMGAVGAIGIVEATTSVGLGLQPGELSALALVFGIVDVVAGTTIHRFRLSKEQKASDRD